MATTPATEESVIFAACIQAAAVIHKGEVDGSSEQRELLIRHAVEYYEEALAVWIAGED